MSPPAFDIVLSLCCCVRAFSYRQIVEGFFEGRQVKANRRIVTLENNQLVVKKRLLIRDIGELACPIVTWTRGDQAPHFQAIVGIVRRRWVGAPTKVTYVVLAGPMAQTLFGYRAPGSLKRPLQASHDLGLAEAYLAVRHSRPSLAKFWKGEDVAPKQRGSIPDAICFGPDGSPRLAVEFCGLYSASRLQAFHHHCEDRRLSYELW